VVSCTGATEVVLPYELLEAVAIRRGGRPLGIVDLALPHDVDPGAGELPGIVLADLATLARMKDADGGVVAEDVELARAIVADEVVAFTAARRAAQVAPTVVALRSMGDAVIEAELARLEGKLPDLDDRSRQEIATAVRRVVDKLLHSPTVRVKELASSPDGASYESALRELFSLDRRVVEAVARPAADDAAEGEGIA
jgi:glutamyl-tRNA reductase